ncbi:MULTISPECIES: fimbrial protein [Providencia]|uniref:fimbrial protein n=1 Tax=Providencia TaxID=586 RepID=UPI00197FA19A|nr:MULTISPECIES: fimbrial protein [Providencia]MBN4864096.1 fimbrial protein [Providencia stuartii]MBN4873418.1 fimbrial protein [Providencia stuartii]MBN4877461.1 fimbrial protein [Providencia stuartii]MBN4882619.1 fimbrial protein [Providencia stuartii]
MSISNNKILKDIAIATSLAVVALLPQSVFGYPHGAVIPDGGTYTFEARMNNQLLINEKDAETVFNFDVTDWPYFDIYCQTYMQPGGPGNNNPDSGMTFDFMSTIPQSMQNPGYLTLNEYFDVKVEIQLGGTQPRKVAVPASNLWNGGSDPMECRPTSTNSRPYAVTLRTGSSGTVTFRLKKPIINGITINQAELVQVFAKKGTATNGLTSYAPIPSTRVVLAAGIITVADECTINDGNPINIDFKDVANTSEQLNGINYAEPFNIPVKCRGGSFTTGDLNIKLSLLPGASGQADFNADYYGTLKNGVKRTNLGIVIKENLTGALVKPNQAYTVPNFFNNQGTWNLTAAPIAAPGSTVDDGEFTATGTILAEFQ